MKFIYKILIVLGTFILSTVFFTTRLKEQTFTVSADTAVMGESTLPVLEAVVDGKEINLMHGYASDMTDGAIRENITPVHIDEKTFSINVIEDHTQTKKLMVEVFDDDGKTSLETAQVITFSDSNLLKSPSAGFINAADVIGAGSFGKNGDAKLAKIILTGDYAEGREYPAKITVITSESRRIYYYTRLKFLKNPQVDEKIDFIEFFHKSTFDKAEVRDIEKYLETTGNADETSFAHVSINNSTELVSYNMLSPVEVYREIPTITECEDSTISASLDFVIKVDTGNGISYYNVTENFRFMYTADRVYLYGYDRYMKQIFDLKQTSLSKSEFKLGVTDPSDVDMVISKDKNRAAFTYDGNLYSYDVLSNTLTTVFTFEEKETDYRRDSYGAHDVKILSMSDTGYIYFMVTGYMNRGAYEGRVAVVLYTYDPNTALIQEQAYIPVTTSYEILKSELIDFAYCNSKQVFYFGIYDTIYAYDLVGKSFSVIAADCKDKFVYSKEGGYLAYDSDDSESIIMLKLESGRKTMLRAGNNKIIHVFGICKGNLVYGRGNKNSICVNEDGTAIQMYTEVNVCDSEGEVVKNFTATEGEISKVTVKGNVTDMTVVVPADNVRGYKYKNSEQIISSLKDEKAEIRLSTRTTDKMMREYYITLPDTIYMAEIPASDKTKSMVVNQDTAVRFTRPDYYTGYFYTYAFGKLVGFSTNAGEVVVLADYNAGSVIDMDGVVVWKRGTAGRNKELKINFPDKAVSSKEAFNEALSILLSSKSVIAARKYDRMNQGVIDYISDFVAKSAGIPVRLEEMEYTQMKNFVSAGFPVIAVTEEGKPYIVYGYNDTEVKLYDPGKGKKTSLSYKKFDKEMGDSDWYYIAFY